MIKVYPIKNLNDLECKITRKAISENATLEEKRLNSWEVDNKRAEYLVKNGIAKYLVVESEDNETKTKKINKK